MFNSFVRIYKAFTLSERIVLYTALAIAMIGTMASIYILNQSFLVDIPRSGGTLHEGFVGTPRFINPVLAITDTDKDLTSLVYSGLVRHDSYGNIIPDIASEWKISDDGKEYIFTIRDNAVFHNRTKITSEDVAFTISSVQNPATRSPKRPEWEGVEVTVVDSNHIKFTLGQAYGAFLENASIGIIPKNLWQNISVDEMPYSTFNTNPIGSGPYQVKKVTLNESGLPATIELKRFSKFTLGSPYIKSIIANFYMNPTLRKDALIKGGIDSAGNVSDENATILKEKGFAIIDSPGERMFGLFLNQNEAPVLVHKELRKALSDSVQRNLLVSKILDGFGNIQTGPLPEFTLYEQEGVSGPNMSTSTIPLEDIKAKLASAGWIAGEDGILVKKGKNPERFAFSISTSDNQDLKETANMLKEMWKEIGADVSIKVFEPSQFNLGVIRPRTYDSLLFGITIGREKDYYAFWHSSQRNDPGLNIALYTNSKADKLLESVRMLVDRVVKTEKERAFSLEVQADTPTIFLYSPHFIYITPPHLKGYNAKSLRASGDRFYDIHKWYLETDNVWSFLAPK